MARCVSLITAGVFELVLLLQSRTTGPAIPDRPAWKLTSLFSAPPHQGEPGNQINQKAIRKAKRNTPPALRAVISQSGAERLYITQTISYLALGVNRWWGLMGSPTGSEEVGLIMVGSVGMVLPRQIKEVGAADGDDLHPSIRPGGATSAPLCCRADG